MNAAGRILPLLECVRRVGKDKWIARCPAHSDRTPSLAISRVGDRVLIYDHAGCAVEKVLSAIGLRTADLFDDVAWRPNPEAMRRRRARSQLESWRSRRLTEVCELLRQHDKLVVSAVELLAVKPESDVAWSAMATAYHACTVLEVDHERLNSRDTSQHLEVWRQHREAQSAA